ncbi:hypothetical protein CYMTET_14277 [Cymbomonas tetramitiformis]|uniref:Uncharacterized protein n=1 Tax=Cymbomonas tetramitiformis TaxID=36881 RepID=A0AAE0GGP3_9CHLO|nr:hypothetical protein CYMTET_14277 [Cymbomonas tetramitiformis]
MVAALREAFLAEDEQLSDLFVLDDASITVRAESNQLLFSALELLVHPSSPASDWLESSAQTFPADGKRVLLKFARKLLHADASFQGTSDLLAVTLDYGVDPNENIMSFNAALAAAKRKNILAGRGRRAGPAATAIGSMLPARFGDPPGGQTSAGADVMEILLALRKEVRVLNDKVDGKGFTPRAEKPQHPRTGM